MLAVVVALAAGAPVVVEVYACPTAGLTAVTVDFFLLNLNVVDERLSTMWWPQIEYVNTAEPTITNQSLEILPSGHVKYTMGLTSTFRADLDLRRFPFDRQSLDVRIQSFIYDASRLRFQPSGQKPCWAAGRTQSGVDVASANGPARTASGWLRRPASSITTRACRTSSSGTRHRVRS